ncbi:MAG: hypothetical protein S4CHLAM7_07650 [Chlamydiae bacterium]|nr:hypothetical protein [Chlamydiota bacterium]
MKFFIPALLLSVTFLSAEFNPEKEKLCKELTSYNLLIHNYTEAVSRATDGVKHFPKSQEMRELYIESLAKVRDEKRLLQSWQKFSRDFEHNKYKDSVLENVAWGVIHNAQGSENLATKFTSLIAASIQNDAYSVETIKKTLGESNAILREVALQFCLNFGDQVLKDEIVRLLKEEKVFEVRKKAIEVAQRLKIDEARPILESLLGDEKVSYQEKSQIVAALINYYDSISNEELKELSESSQPGHRLLACELYNHFDLKEQAGLLEELIYDSHKQVRLSALSIMGNLKLTELNGRKIEEVLKSALEDSNPQISLIATWALLHKNPVLTKAKLRHFLLHSDQTIRLQAAGIIGYSLSEMRSLAEEMFEIHPDLYVRANLAFFLVSHRVKVKEASEQLFNLFNAKEMFMFKEVYPSHLCILAPTAMVLEQGNPEAFYPVASLYYQMAQLEILNILAILEDPRAKEAMAVFLDNHHSDITTLSLRSVLKLEDKQAFELMRDFLTHQDKHKRVEAAIVLAMFKRDKEALTVLQETFVDVNRDLKQIILMAIGEIASKDSIPFLMDIVYEPSQSLRVNAAAALVQCLRN